MDFRKPKQSSRNYKKYREENAAKKRGCVFCKINEEKSSIIDEFKWFRIIKNIFPYDVWDGYEVSDHLMIVPKQHTETIGDFSKEELQEYVNILAKYEKMGYSIYARAPQNKRKTVSHEHTHLIMLNYDKPVEWLFNVKSKILWYK